MAVQVFSTLGATSLPWYETCEQGGGARHLVAGHDLGALRMAAGWAREESVTTARPVLLVVAARVPHPRSSPEARA